MIWYKALLELDQQGVMNLNMCKIFDTNRFFKRKISMQDQLLIYSSIIDIT